MSEAATLLSARGIGKSFSGVRALDGVNLDVRAGRVNALLGENGAGKSTLMNILAGVFPPDEGEVLLGGRTVRFHLPREAQQAGVMLVHQEICLVPELSVAENVFLGREPTTRWGTIDYGRLTADAGGWLRRLGVNVAPSTPAGRLSVGTQQLVEIARAIANEPQILILDEPTSALTKHETQALFQLIGELKGQGIGIVYITHKLDELAEIADDVTIFRDGRLVHEAPLGSTRPDELIALMAGRELADFTGQASNTPGEPILVVDRLSVADAAVPNRPLVREASLSVRAGEIVGLFGLMGAGRSELLSALFGAPAGRLEGAIRIDGKLCGFRSPRDAIAAGLALVPEDRKSEGLVLELDVLENAAMASEQFAGPCGWLRQTPRRRMVQRLCEQLRIKTPSLNQPVQHLSGGNQQKVVLAKCLATRPRVLLLDEPTRGVDVAAKQEIHRTIRELVDRGMGVLMVSSELPEVTSVADRILVMAGGRIVGEFAQADASEEALLAAAFRRESSTV